MNNDNLRIGFIGGGNMALAIAGGLVRSGHAPERLTIADPDPAQRESVQSIDTGIRVTGQNTDAISNADVVVLAVKPQIMATAVAGLADPNRQNPPVYLSIAAGITLNTLQQLLEPATAIVRAMPNQPALVEAGMSVLTATSQTSAEQRTWVQYIAEATGEAAWISDESLMDAVTAVSGSGPAYFYLFMEIMESCARDMGLPAELAHRLVRQTGFGAGLAATKSKLELDALRASVTSKGGTTAAAIDVLEQTEFRAIVAQALLSARDKSIELGSAD